MGCFLDQRWPMVSRWSFSNSKFLQVSRTILNILADLSNVLFRMVSDHLLISKFSSSCTNSLVTASKAQITVGITVIFMFHTFFNSLARSRYLSVFLFSFSFTLWSPRTAKSTIRQVLFFLLIIVSSSR